MEEDPHTWPLNDRTNWHRRKFPNNTRTKCPYQTILRSTTREKKLEELPIETLMKKMTKKNEAPIKVANEVKGGKRETLKKFLETIGLHLLLNKIKNDEERIAFILTYMEGGDADSWRAFFLKKLVTTDGEPDFRMWKDFLKQLRDSFKPYDLKGDALNKIIKLRQGTTSIEDHIARFKVLLANLGVTEDSPAALDYFQKSIRIPLLKKIVDWDDIPKTLPKWYEKALKTDNNYHKVQRIPRWDGPKKEEPKPGWNFQKDKDDSAMDVDVITWMYKTMTDEGKTKLMKKGLCFWCKKAGYLSWDCPKKKGKPTTPSTLMAPSTSTAAPKKMTAKELTAHIRSLTALLNGKEKTEFYDEAEKEGFW